MSATRFAAWCAALTIAMWGVVVPVAEAVTTTVSLGGASAIVMPGGQGRILLEAGDLSFLEGKVVTRAALKITVGNAAPTQDLELRVGAISTAWSAGNATWYSPWNEPGGDWDPANVRVVHLVAGRPVGTVRCDVSPIVRDIADGEAADYGLILMAAPSHNEGRLATSELAWFGGSPTVTLEVSYRSLPAQARNVGSKRQRGREASGP
jgi:hypothetical protein